MMILPKFVQAKDQACLAFFDLQKPEQILSTHWLRLYLYTLGKEGLREMQSELKLVEAGANEL